MPGHTKCCTCQAKSCSQNWRSDAPKMQPLSGNQRPDLLTSLMNMSLVLRLPCKMHLSRSSSNVPHLPSFFGNATKPSRLAHFWQGAQSLAPATRNDIWTSKSAPRMVCFAPFGFEMCFAPKRRALFRHLNFQKGSEREVFLAFSLASVLRATTACTFSTSQLQKVLRGCGALCILTSKCASRHNDVHFYRFFNSSTSKNARSPSVFNTFDFEMCFAPQRRALFRHLNFHKCSKHGVLLAFWLRNVLRVTRACNFSSLIRPVGALASLLFNPPEPQIIGKTLCFATFLPFRAPASSFFWLFLFSDLLSSSLLFSDSSHLCFSICPYCRKFDF